jgi:formylglycine-generating enzyme required for sulfatase activity
LNPEPSFFKGDLPEDNRRSEHDRRPVESVSWFDAQEFCRRLSRRTGKTYALPSESQWEYACRAGTTTPYAFGTTLSLRQANVANVANVASLGTTEVGSFPANLWGLHDMHGNVWEWCLDHWHHGYEGAPADGTAWLSTKDQQDQLTTKPLKGVIDDSEPRLLRGGSWSTLPGFCRSAYRFLNHPDDANFNVGFRVVCLPQDPSLNP